MEFKSGEDTASPTTLASSSSQGSLERKGDAPHPVDQPPRKLKRLPWILLSGSMLLAEMQSALDSTLTANLQPDIVRDLGQISKFPWINVAFSLASASSCLTWGQLCQSFDKKIILLTARALFAAGTTLSAASPTMDAFIIGKAITGLGASGTYISVIAIVTALTTGKNNNRYFGYIGFMWGLGTILGPLIGGCFAVPNVGWRWSFYFNLIYCAAVSPAFIFILPSLKSDFPEQKLWYRIQRIDYAGSILFAGALCSGIMALSFGGAQYSWDNPRVIALLCVSPCLSCIFILQQITTIFTSKQNRILPLHILRSKEMWILIFQTGCSISILYIVIYYIPLYLQFVRNETAIQSAIDNLPFLVTTVAAMIFSGHLLRRAPYYKIWFIAGSLLSLTLGACLYTTEIDTPQNRIYGFLALGGIGVGLFAMNAGPIMAAIVKAGDGGNASSIFGCVDTICSVISVAVANSIFVNLATDKIQLILTNLPRSEVQSAIAGIGASITEGLPAAQKESVLVAILYAIKQVWIQTIATAGFSFVLSMFMRNDKLAK